MISLNIWSLVFTIINLLVLFLLLKKFLIGPVNNIIAQREEMIHSDMASAKAAKDDADKLKKQYEATLAGVKEECEGIREKSRQDAKTEHDKILAEADRKSHRIMKDAEETIKQEREKALNNMENEVAGLAMTAASKIIGNSIDSNINAALYDEFLKKAGDANDADNT